MGLFGDLLGSVVGSGEWSINGEWNGGGLEK
jgi:hypothetical protein